MIGFFNPARGNAILSPVRVASSAETTTLDAVKREMCAKLA